MKKQLWTTSFTSPCFSLPMASKKNTNLQDNNKPPKVLAISSLPANGNAGLKMLMSVIGNRLIPVPSLVLSGIGSLPGFQKFPIPFRDLLYSSVALAAEREESLVLYTGYFYEASQVGIVADLIREYRGLISMVVVDPVCGDKGKPYQPRSVIEALPTLLSMADLGLPNLTEAMLLSNSPEDFTPERHAVYTKGLAQTYPETDLVITGIEKAGQLCNRYVTAGATDFQDFTHERQPIYYGGSGDAFAALLMYYRFYQKLSMEDSISKAGKVIAQFVGTSFAQQSADLLIGNQY